MAFRIRKPSQESFFALNAIPLYSYAIPLVRTGRGTAVATLPASCGEGLGVGLSKVRSPRTFDRR